MSQEIKQSCLSRDLSIGGVDLDNTLLREVIQTGENLPAKVQSSEKSTDEKIKEYSVLKSSHPAYRKSDLVLMYPDIPEEIILKVIEGFECLKEAYHLYGLERATTIPKCHLSPPKVMEHQSIQNHFKRYGDEIKKNHMIKWEVSCATTKALDFLRKSQDPSLWVSYFKYKTCAFFAYFEGQELPPSPPGLDNDKPSIIFFNKFVNALKRRSLKDKLRPRKVFQSFLMTINQSKMGMPRDVESSIQKAEEKCAKHLTTEPPPLVDRVLELRRDVIISGKTHLRQEDIDYHELTKVVINKETVCHQLRRTVREMFIDASYTTEIHYEPFYPSTSSNYNRTRGAMGAVGEVMQFIRDDVELSQFLDQELIKMKIQPVKFREEISRKYGDRGILEQESIDPDSEHLGNAINFDDEAFKSQWVKLFDRLFEKAYTEEPLVEALGLLEALKIRVISKGPPFLYTVLKPLQKFLWGVLKRNSVFQLIGTPITVDLINQVMGHPEQNEVIVNGDYKASTDNLHSWVSECLANELCDVLNTNGRRMKELDPNFSYKRITLRHREMLLRSLIHHKFEVDGIWKDQKEGQLMGSITSFPFLCLANAAFCRWSLEIANNCEYRLSDRPVGYAKRAPLLINGDDCTLKGNRLFLRNCWEQITSFGGLTSSVGKTFFSLPERPICMINSVAFDYDFESQQWEERKYVNMGILLGKKRSIGISSIGDDQVPYGGLGSLHRELFKQSPVEIWPAVSQRFVYYNAKTLKQCPNIPWYMPEYLGGPGLVPNKPYSDEDLRCATLLIMNMKSDGSFHNRRLAVEKYTAPQDWVLHQLVKERIEPWARSVGMTSNYLSLRNLNAYEYNLKDLDEIDIFQDDWVSEMNINTPWESLEDNYAKLYKYLIIETLFRNLMNDVYRPVSLRDLEARPRIVETTQRMAEQAEKRRLKMNCRAWEQVHRDIYSIYNVVILKDHEIAHEKKTFVVPVVGYSIEKEFHDDLVNIQALIHGLT